MACTFLVKFECWQQSDAECLQSLGLVIQVQLLDVTKYFLVLRNGFWILVPLRSGAIQSVLVGEADTKLMLKFWLITTLSIYDCDLRCSVLLRSSGSYCLDSD